MPDQAPTSTKKPPAHEVILNELKRIAAGIPAFAASEDHKSGEISVSNLAVLLGVLRKMFVPEDARGLLITELEILQRSDDLAAPRKIFESSGRDPFLFCIGEMRKG